jgi:hypothetical protein
MNRSNLSYLLALALMAGITVSAALVHGNLLRRWESVEDTTAARALVEKLPREFGEWRLTEEMPLTDSAVQILQCAGYANRLYTNQRTGDQIAVTLLLGPSGPLTVHTPEICLSSRDFESMGAADQVTIHTEESAARFYYAMFRSTTPTLPPIEIYYGWNNYHGWEAPDAPRFAYGGDPQLFKLQVVSQLWPNVAAGEGGLAAKFLSSLLSAMPDELKVRRSTPPTPVTTPSKPE